MRRTFLVYSGIFPTLWKAEEGDVVQDQRYLSFGTRGSAVEAERLPERLAGLPEGEWTTGRATDYRFPILAPVETTWKIAVPHRFNSTPPKFTRTQDECESPKAEARFSIWRRKMYKHKFPVRQLIAPARRSHHVAILNFYTGAMPASSHTVVDVIMIVGEAARQM